MDNPRIIGHVVSVQGFRVKVELLPETKSSMRATPDGVQVAIAINAYLTFSIGAGQFVVGMITDLESRQSYDPSTDEDLTLELMKPRRVATVQLLGTIEQGGKSFTPGITILPTLDTPAETSSSDLLKSVFETPPRRNRPSEYRGEDFDYELRLGCPTGQPSNAIKASYNDLFSRPLAIVGNTGSGKSYSVSSLIQKAMAALADDGNEPHIFILDINGEYGPAVVKAPEVEKRPDCVYLNNKEFSIPIWLFNASEICSWLSASEQTQEPVLKDWWAIAKADAGVKGGGDAANLLRHAIGKASIIIQTLDQSKTTYKQICTQHFKILLDYVGARKFDSVKKLRDSLVPHHKEYKAEKPDWTPPENEAEIRAAAVEAIKELKQAIINDSGGAEIAAATADSPRYIPRSRLVDPTLLDSATPAEDVGRIEAHLTTLKLRLKTRLDDTRWKAFLNYEDAATKVSSLEDWLQQFGLGAMSGPRVSVIDLSMLSHEVLPYACTVIGRVLLEARENLAASGRYKHPWVLVLEEAHNYLDQTAHS